MKVGRVRQARMSEGSKFQVVAATTEKAHQARSVLVLGATSSGALDDRRCRTGTVVWNRSLRYAVILGRSYLKCWPAAGVLYLSHLHTTWSAAQQLDSGLLNAHIPGFTFYYDKEAQCHQTFMIAEDLHTRLCVRIVRWLKTQLLDTYVTSPLCMKQQP